MKRQQLLQILTHVQREVLKMPVPTVSVLVIPLGSSGVKRHLYHTCVRVGKHLLEFGAVSGVQLHSFAPPSWLVQETLTFPSRLSARDTIAAIREVLERFDAQAYDLLRCNCNHFSKAVVDAVSTREYPRWINRAARQAEPFGCLVPPEFLRVDPYTRHRRLPSKRFRCVTGFRNCITACCMPGPAA
ncbi:MAG: hypothetical protein KVP17_002170 [Porospora cf. gigantea B]|uniref:uncharacterized protein n=1 Tax=Porospora cf. gigantea B TaxID=2853592 RepID=UPI003571A510|nr:MAG: hypothetical protein KVP17_002170 [Porospora cf. gigantea B]